MPSYVQTRLDIWKRLKTRQDEVLAKKPRDIMTVTFPDGRTEEGFTWDTTPFEVVKELSNTFAAEVIAAKVNGQLWDLERPFETDSTVQFLKFREPEAKAVYWNSTAFILGDALERAFGEQHNALLATAAVNENGLYCDMQTDKKTVNLHYFDSTLLQLLTICPFLFQITTKEIETKMIRSLFVKHQFERLEIGKSDLLELFAYNKFKIDHINENVPDDGTATVYRCGTYIDICELPHVRYNKKIKAYKLRKVWPSQRQSIISFN